jgi:hypothetical protein
VVPDPRTFVIEGRSSVVRKAARSPVAAGSVTVFAMVLAHCFGLAYRAMPANDSPAPACGASPWIDGADVDGGTALEHACSLGSKASRRVFVITPRHEPSVGSVGDSYDNALAETINGLYKVEVIPSTRAVAQLRGGRVRDAGLGRLVQQSPPAGAHR